MHEKMRFISFLVVSILASCQGFMNQQPLATSPTTLQQGSLIYLEDLNQDSPSNLWEQFFQQRGALEIWQELEKHDNALHIHLNTLKDPLIPMEDQADQVGAGIIHYLSYRNPEVKELKIRGDDNNTTKQLTNLSPAIGNLVNLTHLDISINQLTTLPTTIWNLVNLSSLGLKGSLLTTLPTTIWNLVNLTHLDLSYNQLTTLPISISNLVNLQFLWLSYNQLTTLPTTVGNLVNLQYLYLDQNQLTESPLFISQLTNLHYLNLSQNKLTALPAKLTTCFLNLESVNLDKDVWLQANDWLQAQELTGPIDQATLRNYSYEVLPRSLVTICSNHVQNRYNQATDTSRQAIIARLPEDLQPSNLNKRIERECASIHHNQRMIYFEQIKNQQIPFYWDEAIVTNQDVKNMLEALKDKQVFLVSEDRIPN